MSTIRRHPLTRGRCGILALWLALSLLAAIRPGHADLLPARLEIMWSTPITVEPAPTSTTPKSRGLVLGAGAVSPDGAVVFLGSMLGARLPDRVLLLDAEKAGPNAITPLGLTTPDPAGRGSPWAGLFGLRKRIHGRVIMSFALGAEGEMWLGGYANGYTGIDSNPHRDAYVARLDGAGKLIWERAYDEGGWLSIESMAPAAAGGLVWVGRDVRGSRLAKIDPDGTLMAERRFGNGKGAAVVPLRSGRFLIAGFTSEGRAAAYRDEVSTWLLDEAGELHGPARVREAINRASSSYFGSIAASAAGDGAYVASSWGDSAHLQAVEVACVGADGALLWRRELPETVNGEGRFGEACEPVLATLANGDALVACALNGQIQLHQLDQTTGEQKTARLPLPACQRAHPAALFLMTRPDGSMFLGGSRPESNVAANCSWMGRLITRGE